MLRNSQEHIDCILAKLRADEVDARDQKAAVECLERTVMPQVNVDCYLFWLSGSGQQDLFSTGPLLTTRG